MSLFELVDGSGRGMVVGGAHVDMEFREEADAQGRADERLITIEKPEDLLSPEAISAAAEDIRASEAIRRSDHSAELAARSGNPAVRELGNTMIHGVGTIRF